MKSFVSLLHFLVLSSLCVPFLIYSFLSRSVHNHAGGFFKAPQQMLRTHRSLKAYCATCDGGEEKDDQFFIFPSNGAAVE
jgi:hypothetical protein